MTANVAGKTATVTVNLNARTGVSITGPTTAVAAGTPVTFTVGVGAAPAMNIRDVTIDFGDGSAQLARGHQHVDARPAHLHRRGLLPGVGDGDRCERLHGDCRDVRDDPAAAAAERHHPGRSRRTRCRVRRSSLRRAVSGATSTILRYEWTFEGGSPPTVTTTGNRATATFTGTGTRVITVRVVQASGPAGDGTTVINLQSGGGVAAVKRSRVRSSAKLQDKARVPSVGRWALSISNYWSFESRYEVAGTSGRS